MSLLRVLLLGLLFGTAEEPGGRLGVGFRLGAKRSVGSSFVDGGMNSEFYY